MEKIKTLRGFKDIFGDEMGKFRRIEEAARKYCKLLGFREIELPILEKTELFVRSIGDATDIVEKEMFTFTDIGGDSLTLRPEATAGVVRHYLQESLHAKERVTRCFTLGPMFRHERPQKGRFREFHQFDVEAFGVSEALIDAQLIWMISLILSDLAVSSYAVEVNSVGCKACREPFREVLVRYFEERKENLCEDCLRRMNRNPLRIFDCKSTGCIEVTKESPLLYDHLCAECKDHFDNFLDLMNRFDVPVVVNKRLVRGLDYYTKTVFEVTSNDLGAQKAFAAGGRYDNLVEEMGGPKTPAIGFAVGVERLAMLIPEGTVQGGPLTFFACLGGKAQEFFVPFQKAFAAHGMKLDYSFESRSLKSQMRYADSLGARFVLILGDEEIDKGIITVRDMEMKTQQEINLDAGEVLACLEKTAS